MVSTKSLLEKSNLLSVNQTNAQIKLLEMWKATTIQDYPIEVKKTKYDENSTTTRACTNGKLIEPGKKPITLKGFKVMQQDCGILRRLISHCATQYQVQKKPSKNLSKHYLSSLTD